MNLNMKKLGSVLLSFSLLAVLTISSCKKEKQDPEDNENEVITTMEIRVIEQGTANTEKFIWEDADGEGGNQPAIQVIQLAAGKVYEVELTILDKTKNPVENTTEEIREEGADHRFYFIPSGDTGLTIDGLDKDVNGTSLGIHSVWTTADAGTGTMKIILRHYPEGNKEETDLVTSPKSSTDAEMEFDVVVVAP